MDFIFETIAIVDGTVTALDLHLNRLRFQCREVGVAPPEKKVLIDFLSKQQLGRGHWRFKVSVGKKSTMTLEPYAPPTETSWRLCLFLKEIVNSRPYLKTSATISRSRIKEYAHARGFDDGLTCSSEGFLLEATYANLFWHHDGAFFTPAKELPLVWGVTLQQIEDLFPVYHVKATPEEIPPHANVYVCNSMMGLMPVSAIEKQQFPVDSEFHRRITEAYLNNRERTPIRV
ncbi:MAG: aminotransferase class IV [Chlamydiales bacterium]|nr:aminotransferase class IV [Chlamydiales bacterium]